MFKEKRILFLEVLPPFRKKGSRFEKYKPKEYSETSSGQLEKIERELSQKEAQKVLEKLEEVGSFKCPKCNGRTISKDFSNKKTINFKCRDCGYKWKIDK